MVLESKILVNWAEVASNLIYGDREQTHGDPGKNLRCIAELWTSYLRNRYSLSEHDMALTTNDVCDMMSLLKLARSANNPDNEDNPIDLIGYQLLKQRVAVGVNNIDTNLEKDKDGN